MDDNTRTEVEAAVFRRILRHFDDNKDVQNIDLMNLAGFCRNCLAKWYRTAAKDRGHEISYEGAREVVYDEPYADWKAKYQHNPGDDKGALFSAEEPRGPAE